MPDIPPALNSGTDGTGLPWAPATDGLRNIIGTVEGNRIQGYSVVIWATSSTVSGDGDQGADPNKLYLITDRLTNTSPAVAAQETFTDLRDAAGGEVLRGVSFTPGTPSPPTSPSAGAFINGRPKQLFGLPFSLPKPACQAPLVVEECPTAASPLTVPRRRRSVFSEF